jgi:excisionase family DNA binding protein
MSIKLHQPRELLPIAEVARMLSISVSSVRRFVDARRIPFHKIGGSIRFAKTDVVAFVEKTRFEAIDQ